MDPAMANNPGPREKFETFIYIKVLKLFFNEKKLVGGNYGGAPNPVFSGN